MLELSFLKFRENRPAVSISNQDSINYRYKPSFACYWRVVNQVPIVFGQRYVGDSYEGMEAVKFSELVQPMVLIQGYTFQPNGSLNRGLAKFYVLGSDALVYQWDFGDGSTGEGEALNHVYAKNGTYNVKVTAIRTNGQRISAQRNFTITTVR